MKKLLLLMLAVTTLGVSASPFPKEAFFSEKKIGATCKDGTTTKETGKNACKDNGGVKSWIEIP